VKHTKYLLAAFAVVFGFGFGTPALAQNLQTDPSPVLPPNFLGPQLIVWSQLQRPQPVPQPLPDRPDRESGQSNPGAHEQLLRTSCERYQGYEGRIRNEGGGGFVKVKSLADSSCEFYQPGDSTKGNR
jgi:hypothetical protein